jgi:hypothetical protein
MNHGAWTLALALACTPLSPSSLKERRERESWPDPTCDPLPPARPPGARVHVSRRDGERMIRTLDVVFVDDAACPSSFAGIPPPECLHATPAAMDSIWAELVATELHRVEQERHGECIHCGGPWISIEWPGGGCERGVSVHHDIGVGSWERFDGAVRFLEGIADAVHAKGPPETNDDDLE